MTLSKLQKLIKKKTITQVLKSFLIKNLIKNFKKVPYQRT